MTMPYQRYHSISNTEQFLLSLCDARATPRVPGAVRDQARRLLRHYPTSLDLEALAESRPDIIQRYTETTNDHAS